MSLMMSLHIVKMYFSPNFNILRGMFTLASIIQTKSKKGMENENPFISNWIELLFHYFH